MKSQHLSGVLLHLLLFIACQSNALASIVDQTQTNNGASFGMGTGGNTAQQGITAGVSGYLDGFEIWSNGIGLNSSVDVTVFVNVGAPWQIDTNQFETTITFTTSDIGSWFYVDTSTASIILNAGEIYSIGVTPSNSYDPGGYINNPYTNGNFYFNGVESTSFDLGFRTYMTTVPVPAALCLFGSGLLGLIGVARKKAV